MSMDRHIILPLCFNLISVITAEVCTYDDGFEVTTFVCYSGCCSQDCCDDYWSNSAIAGIVVAVLISSAIVVAIITAMCCRICRKNVPDRRIYMEDMRPIVSSGHNFREQLATPFTVFPTTTPVQPPSYEQAVQSGSRNTEPDKF